MKPTVLNKLSLSLLLMLYLFVPLSISAASLIIEEDTDIAVIDTDSESCATSVHDPVNIYDESSYMLSVDAGEDKTSCGGGVSLSATASGAEDCSGCCTRSASNTTQCSDGYVYAFWLSGGTKRPFAITGNSSVTWEECDGSIRFIATNLRAVDGSGETISLDFTYSGKRNSPDGDHKEHSCNSRFSSSDWAYYTNLSGTFTSSDHGTFNVSRRGSAFQVGTGANDTSSSLSFGASGWFDVSGGDGYWREGDVNIVLSSTCSSTGNGGTELNYEWSTGQTGSAINVNQSGNYQVTVTDCRGNTATDEVSVIVGTLSTISAAPSGIIACDESSTVSLVTRGVGFATYQWTGPNGFTSNISDPVVENPGTYTIIATTSDGCRASASVRVESEETPRAVASNDGPINCSKPTVTLRASGGGTYQWTGPDNFSSTSATPTVSVAGTYDVVVTGANGCTATASTIITGLCDQIPTIGDLVFNDLDQDGIQDAGEPGVSGVRVQLISAGPDGQFHTGDDFVVDRTVTDANGLYSFEEVAPGEYCIEVLARTIPLGYVFSPANAGGSDVDSDADALGKIPPFTVTAGQPDDLSFDAGIYEDLPVLPTIGDLVFNDLDEDGIQDPNEPGVPGVQVELLSPGPDGQFHTGDDVVVDTNITDADGLYSFDEVAPGEYCIQIIENTIPSNYVFSPANAGGDTVDSDADGLGKIPAFTVSPDQADDLSFDAGIYEARATNIGDLVFNDLDEDGIQDPNEPGVSGVRVELLSPGPDGQFHTGDDLVVDRDVTDANGIYSFEEVAPGEYCIQILASTVPFGFVFTRANAGGDDVDSDADALGKIPAFTVTPGADDLSFDAGIYESTVTNIGDLVFNDLNEDGIQDPNEPGVPGVRVELLSPGPDGQFHTGDDFVVNRDVTDANGIYSFENVEAGEYCIQILANTIPSGFVFTRANAGGDDVDSDADALGKIPAFTVTPGPDDLSFDAGIYEGAVTNIGDLVFNDLDKDGIQDPNEPGVSGVRVELLSPGPDGQFHTGDDVVVDRDVTDRNGLYSFEEVTPGEYCIQVLENTIPFGYVFTAANAGRDELDSDADALGKIPVFTVRPGQADNLSFDAGIYEEAADLPNIGDLVFNDLDKDGIQDANEPGVSGVRVELLSPGPDGQFHTGDDMVVDRDVTDANGIYGFEDVAPGEYCIQVLANTIPSDYVFTASNAGGDTVDSDADALGKIPAFTVTAGQADDLSFDAGIYEEVSIPQVSITDIVVNEEDGIAILEICLDQVATEFTYVQFQTASATARNEEDYIDQSGYAFIDEGEQCTQVTFDIVDDQRPEEDEEFIVILSDPYNTEIADGEGKVIILDTDSPENVECPGVEAYEEDGNLVVAGLIAPIEIVQIFDSSFDVVFRCMNDCDPIEIVENLPDGEYLVKINCYSITWGLLCTEEIKVRIGEEECAENVTIGGRLGGEESNCGSYNPSLITSVLPASGGNTSDAIEYMWLSSTVDCPSEETDAIPGATGATYDPGPITQTTYYLRCSRRVGCTVWVESNCIVKDVYCPNGLNTPSVEGNSLTRTPRGNTTLENTTQTDRILIDTKDITQSKRTDIKFYPNPVRDLINIDLSRLAGKSGKIYLSNQIGQVVKTLDLGIISTSAIQIPVGSLSGGLYHLTIVSEGQLVTVEKMMIQ